MDNFESIVGFPNKNYEITYQPGKIYGLAYINQLTPGWICNAGTLPYLFGCYQTFMALNDMIPEEQNEYYGTIFFELNEELEPIKVITAFNSTNKFSLETTGMNDDVSSKMIDISYLVGDDIPKLEFEI